MIDSDRLLAEPKSYHVSLELMASILCSVATAEQEPKATHTLYTGATKYL